MRSLFTRHFSSPYLQTDCETSEAFFFPAGTDRELVIDTLEEYAEFQEWTRTRRYEVIGDAINSNCFQEVLGESQSMNEIQVDL